MITKKQSKIVVVGSGFGGIASALRMRALGHEVTIIEKLNAIGGRAQVFNINGFKHDAGPTVITAPFMFDDLFKLFGENVSRTLSHNIKQGRPSTRVHASSEIISASEEE